MMQQGYGREGTGRIRDTDVKAWDATGIRTGMDATGIQTGRDATEIQT